MNYYEELGVSPQATEQEIRKAHRRLVKQMHPDAQPDQRLKMEAETQMRRLNSMVSTLLDPEQRRSYDDQLRASFDATERSSSVPTSFGGIPWWMASALAAIILTLAAVWLWADHMGNASGKKSGRNAVFIAADDHPLVTPQAPAFPNPNSSGASPAPVSDLGHASGGISSTVSELAPVPKAAPKKEQESKPPLTATNQPPVVTPKPVAPPAATRSDIRKAEPPALAKSTKPKGIEAKRRTAKNSPPNKKQFQLPEGTLIASAAPTHGGDRSQLPAPPGVNSQGGHDYNSSALPGSSLPAAEPPPKVSGVVISTSSNASSNSPSTGGDPLEGEWVYAPKEPERRRAGFYPPEYIDLKLFGSGNPGSLKGQYSAKYVVTDRPVAPEVNFQLASVSKGSRKFIWQSSNGAKGTLSIDPIDERTIRIDWHTTSSMREPALTSGQATLVRK